MFKEQLYLSSIANDAAPLAQKYGLGLEIAEYCTAWNMDEHFAETDSLVREKMRYADRFIFHAPFNELCPAAIDPMVLELTRKRYEQACRLANCYGIKKIVVHSGYIPTVYFKKWFFERSVFFWRDFFAGLEEDTIFVLENVMEDEPELLASIVCAVDDPRFGLCLDVGHANAELSSVPVLRWIQTAAPYLRHVHLHSNEGGYDLHGDLGSGTVPMAEVLDTILSACPDATLTVETISAENSVQWLIANGYLEA